MFWSYNTSIICVLFREYRPIMIQTKGAISLAMSTATSKTSFQSVLIYDNRHVVHDENRGRCA